MGTKKIVIDKGLPKEFKYLCAGTSVNIDITTPAGQVGRFRSIFVGYFPDKYILIEHPDSNKLGKYEQYITQDSQITVRALVEGHEASAIAFISSVKQTLSLPSRLIALNFPRDMIVHNLRSTKRIQTEIPAKITLDKKQWSALMTDFSLTGCHMHVLQGGYNYIKEDQKINIVLDNKDESELALEAIVCNVKRVAKGIKFGCKFAEEQGDKVQKILYLVL